MTLIEELGKKPRWMAKAACASGDYDPDDWFPEQGTFEGDRKKERALSVCRRCPVKIQCLRDALRTEDIVWGIRGQTTQHQRSRLRGRLRRLGRRL
jgi:WhiB family redox-sensing transcriptional regulator